VVGVYVREEHGRLVRVATYGLEPKSRPGAGKGRHDGLLAQAVREGA
jgi:hypothetical protein